MYNQCNMSSNKIEVKRQKNKRQKNPTNVSIKSKHLHSFGVFVRNNDDKYV